MTPKERVEKVFNEAVGRDLTSWEKHTFLPSIKNFSKLSEKQERILSQIENKISDRLEDEED